METKTSPFRKGKLPDEPNTIIQNVINGLSGTAPLHRRNLHGGDGAYCARKNSAMLNMPDDQMVEMSAASAFYFSIGSAVHETIQKALTKTGMLIASEFRINSIGINIGGYVDAIVRIDDKPRILEIKTCGGLPAKPKPEHVFQAMTYALITGIPDPILFYVSRSVASWDGKLITKQFELESTKAAYIQVATGLYRSLYYAEAKRLADIPVHIESARECGFCPFVNTCWNEVGSFPVVRPTADEKAEIEAKVKASMITLVKGALGWPNENVLETARVLKEMKGIDLY